MAKIIFDENKCTGCSACALACMDQNDIDPAQTRPFRRIVEIEEENFSFQSRSCRHCDDAPCAAACPAGSLFYDEALRLTRYAPETCLACLVCVSACPHDAVSVMPDGRPGKCDGCVERQMAGLLPACVRVCPTGALYLL